ncbi:unnamed protein product [Leptidea sinapis]|uniref:Uncharacterized protein n=1 Tax=Leptidea sinapis TaxID=189913 RepID=A0A5E4QIW3_9NEOP|nr:unnamed protein product [Leptidea sinapis]
MINSRNWFPAGRDARRGGFSSIEDRRSRTAGETKASSCEAHETSTHTPRLDPKLFRVSLYEPIVSLLKPRVSGSEVAPTTCPCCMYSRPVLLPVRSLRGCTSYRHLHDCKADACLRLLHLGPAAIGHKPGQYSPTTDIGWQII